jgi:hypothetical protein
MKPNVIIERGSTPPGEKIMMKHLPLGEEQVVRDLNLVNGAPVTD